MSPGKNRFLESPVLSMRRSRHRRWCFLCLSLKIVTLSPSSGGSLSELILCLASTAPFGCSLTSLLSSRPSFLSVSSIS